MKKLGFKKCRRLSDLCYAVAVVILIATFLIKDRTQPIYMIAVAGVFIFVVIAMALYTRGCRCPKCGELQPRSSKTECCRCHAKLD